MPCWILEGAFSLLNHWGHIVLIYITGGALYDHYVDYNAHPLHWVNLTKLYCCLLELVVVFRGHYCWYETRGECEDVNGRIFIGVSTNFWAIYDAWHACHLYDIKLTNYIYSGCPCIAFDLVYIVDLSVCYIQTCNFISIHANLLLAKLYIEHLNKIPNITTNSIQHKSTTICYITKARPGEGGRDRGAKAINAHYLSHVRGHLDLHPNLHTTDGMGMFNVAFTLGIGLMIKKELSPYIEQFIPNSIY